jgi:retron-type reverse transcriptase
MPTSLRGIANKAGQDRSHRFGNLINVLTVDFLLWSWTFVNKKAAAGVDRESAYDYEQNLVNNAEKLVASVAGGWYRAKLILRKYIPKGGGKMRPLGIPAIADKRLQTAVAKILEAIYEQDFLVSSYGYRPGTSAHKAIKDLSAILRPGCYAWVVEADIKGFFNTIEHDK